MKIDTSFRKKSQAENRAKKLRAKGYHTRVTYSKSEPEHMRYRVWWE